MSILVICLYLQRLRYFLALDTIKNLSFMINQKLISLKVDLNLLDQLDDLCLSRSIKRNRFINDAISELLIAYVCNFSTYQFRRYLCDKLTCV